MKSVSPFRIASPMLQTNKESRCCSTIHNTEKGEREAKNIFTPRRWKKQCCKTLRLMLVTYKANEGSQSEFSEIGPNSSVVISNSFNNLRLYLFLDL